MGVPTGQCTLYSSHDLMYNVPLDIKNATMRGPHVSFTSGEPTGAEDCFSFILRHEVQTMHAVTW